MRFCTDRLAAPATCCFDPPVLGAYSAAGRTGCLGAANAKILGGASGTMQIYISQHSRIGCLPQNRQSACCFFWSAYGWLGIMNKRREYSHACDREISLDARRPHFRKLGSTRKKNRSLLCELRPPDKQQRRHHDEGSTPQHGRFGCLCCGAFCAALFSASSQCHAVWTLRLMHSASCDVAFGEQAASAAAYGGQQAAANVNAKKSATLKSPVPASTEESTVYMW